MSLPHREPGESGGPAESDPEQAVGRLFVGVCLLAEELAREQEPTISRAVCYTNLDTQATLKLSSLTTNNDQGGVDTAITVELYRDNIENTSYFSLSFDGSNHLIDQTLDESGSFLACAEIARELIDCAGSDHHSNTIAEHLAAVLSNLRPGGQPSSFGVVEANAQQLARRHLAELVQETIYYRGSGLSTATYMASHKMADGRGLEVVYNCARLDGESDASLQEIEDYAGTVYEHEYPELEDEEIEIPLLQLVTYDPKGIAEAVCQVEFDGNTSCEIALKDGVDDKFTSSHKVLEAILGRLIDIGTDEVHQEANARYVSGL